MRERRRLFVAFLLHGRAADEVNGLRRALGSNELTRIAPHLTLLEPVNVALHAIEEACREVEEIAASSPPIELELSRAATFSPQGHVLFLSVDGELDLLSRLRRRLEMGELSKPSPRAFVPHVALASHLEKDTAAKATELLSRFSLRVTLDRLAVLALNDLATDPPQPVGERTWQLREETLVGSALLIGRGTQEIRLVASTRLGPRSRRFFEGEGVKAATFSGDLTVAAYLAKELVGAASCRRRGDIAEVESLVVGASRRSSGIGRQLLHYLERVLADEGTTEVVRRTSLTERELFFEHLGYDYAEFAGSNEGWLRRRL